MTVFADIEAVSRGAQVVKDCLPRMALQIDDLLDRDEAFREICIGIGEAQGALAMAQLRRGAGQHQRTIEWRACIDSLVAEAVTVLRSSKVIRFPCARKEPAETAPR